MVGTIGTSQQLSSSVVGEPVDHAQRLEALTRQYQVGVLIAESTHDALGEDAGTHSLREAGQLALEPSRDRIRLFTTAEADLAET